MKNKAPRSFLAALCAFSLFLAPGAGASEGLSLDNAIKEALASNPEILAAKRAYDAASARIMQAGSLNDPMVELEYDRMTADRQLSGNPMKTYAISQEVPFPMKLYLRAKIASKIAKMAFENYKAKELDVISRVKSAYAELVLAYRAIDVNKESKALLEQLSGTAVTRYSTGSGAQVDALKAQVELAKADAELIMLEQRRVTAQAKLNVLLNRAPEEELGIPPFEGTVEFKRPLEEIYSIARENNPELKAYRYAIERGKAAFDLSINEFMPDFTVKFRQMVGRDRVEDGAWAGMLGVTVPLWFVEKQAFGVKEMKAELDMLKAEFSAKEKNVLFDVRDAYARVEAGMKLVAMYETAVLPQAEESVNTGISGYTSGKSDFLLVLDSQRAVVEFKLEHYRAVLDLRVALADLERSAGAGLETAVKKEAGDE